MEKKIAPAMTVLAIELKTNMQMLKQILEDKPRRLVSDAVSNGFHVTGPQYWVYTWVELDPNADFMLKICLPVATFGNPHQESEFRLEKLPPFMHVSTEHLGSWELLGESYSKLMAQMTASDLKPSMVCREVYINCDFEKPENNRTEIQFGILN